MYTLHDYWIYPLLHRSTWLKLLHVIQMLESEFSTLYRVCQLPGIIYTYTRVAFKTLNKLTHNTFLTNHKTWNLLYLSFSLSHAHTLSFFLCLPFLCLHGDFPTWELPAINLLLYLKKERERNDPCMDLTKSMSCLLCVLILHCSDLDIQRFICVPAVRRSESPCLNCLQTLPSSQKYPHSLISFLVSPLSFILPF